MGQVGGRPGNVPLDYIAKLAKPSTEDWYVYSPAIAGAKELALTRRAALNTLLDLARSPEAYDRYSAVSALIGVAGVDPTVVELAEAEQLANDPDEAVVDAAAELIQKLRDVDVDRRRPKGYGHFGL